MSIYCNGCESEETEGQDKVCQEGGQDEQTEKVLSAETPMSIGGGDGFEADRT